MTASTEARPAQPPRALAPLRSYLHGRRGLIVAALLIVAAGLYLGWGWLATAGIAPVLVALAPCAAMCALGLCMNKMGGKSCSTDSQPKVDRNA